MSTKPRRRPQRRPKDEAPREQGLHVATIVTTARMVAVPAAYIERLVVEDLRARNYAPFVRGGDQVATPVVTWTRDASGDVAGCRVEFQHVVEREE